MPTFDLDKDYSASFFPYLGYPGYVAKGTIFRKGKPVKIFEAHARTMAALEKAVREKATEVHRGLIKKR